MSGAWTLTKRHSHGSNSECKATKNRALGPTMHRHYAPLDQRQEWWSRLVEGRQTSQLWKILGVWDVIEMGDGTGFKRHTKQVRRSLLLGISTPASSLGLCSSLSVDAQTQSVRTSNWKYTRRRAVSGTSLIVCSALDILSGQLTHGFTCMEVLKKRRPTSRPIQLWKSTFLTCSEICLLSKLNSKLSSVRRKRGMAERVRGKQQQQMVLMVALTALKWTHWLAIRIKFAWIVLSLKWIQALVKPLLSHCQRYLRNVKLEPEHKIQFRSRTHRTRYTICSYLTYSDLVSGLRRTMVKAILPSEGSTFWPLQTKPSEWYRNNQWCWELTLQSKFLAIFMASTKT